MSAPAQTPNSNRGLPAQILCTPPYYNPLKLDGVTASIDNVRLKFVYSKSSFDYEASRRFDTLVDLLEKLTSIPLFMEGSVDIRHTESGFRIGNFAHTVTFKLQDGNAFAVLVGRFDYKSSVRQISPEAVIDFNPNKIPAKVWKRIVGILSAQAIKVNVQRFDLALDFPMLRNLLQLVQRPGSRYQALSDPEFVKTEYTGERSHHAAIKLYDKAAELQLPLPLTRLEITIEKSKFKGLPQLMPDIISLAPLEFSLDFDKLPPIVQAVIVHPDLYELMMKSVSRNTWAKYKALLEQYRPQGGGFFFTLPDQQLKQIERYVRTYVAELPTAHLHQEVSA